MHELVNMLEVDTPLGKGTAILIESGDHDYHWTVVLHDNRAIVTFRQHQIKATRNYSNAWGMSDTDMKKALK